MGLPYSSRLTRDFDGSNLPRIVVNTGVYSARRIWFYELHGRRPVEDYEWAYRGVTPNDLLREAARKTPFRTMGALIVFPHMVADVLWSGRGRETNEHRKYYTTGGPNYMLLSEAAETVELEHEFEKKHGIVGCPAEAVVYAAEAKLWSNAVSIPAYLESGSEGSDFDVSLLHLLQGISVVNPSKLEEFWASAEQQAHVFNPNGELKRVFGDKAVFID
ncbi:MAG: hypothetical protein HY513_05040 [Candidatus Aenigmarchaeota archaeon]|nr:hypothetical protein [Candidatus Aenigmarchaeota archaeon]